MAAGLGVLVGAGVGVGVGSSTTEKADRKTLLTPGAPKSDRCSVIVTVDSMGSGGLPTGGYDLRSSASPPTVAHTSTAVITSTGWWPSTDTKTSMKRAPADVMKISAHSSSSRYKDGAATVRVNAIDTPCA